MKNNKKIGLSLSGGGYRATIYHLGTLRKLKEMNLLDKIDVISTISGGSITGAYYGLKGNDFDAFDKGLINIVKKSIIKGIYFSTRFICIILSLLVILSSIVLLSFTNYAWFSTLLLLITVFIIIKY